MGKEVGEKGKEGRKGKKMERGIYSVSIEVEILQYVTRNQ